MDRKTFLKTTLGCALCSVTPIEGSTACDAAFLRDWLSTFVQKEERTINRETLVKLMEERGRACCRALDFRQKLIRDSQGDLDRLVELLGKIVGPENSRRDGNTVTLIYPSGKCGCGWSPKRAPSPNDPYCDCSKANNQALFQIVTGKPVQVEVAESPRRGGSRCRFVIHLG